MICPKCDTKQCYVCKTTIQGYDHFRRGEGPGCPMYSDTEKLHAAEVREKYFFIYIFLKLFISLYFYQVQKAAEDLNKAIEDLQKDGVEISYDTEKGLLEKGKVLKYE